MKIKEWKDNQENKVPEKGHLRKILNTKMERLGLEGEWTHFFTEIGKGEDECW